MNNYGTVHEKIVARIRSKEFPPGSTTHVLPFTTPSAVIRLKLRIGSSVRRRELMHCARDFLLPISVVLLLISIFVTHRSFIAVETMSGNQDYKSAKSIYDFTAVSIKGEEVPLSKYENHVCLIVNVASKCGLTATNYKELNELYDEYSESKGLRILAFPCNQFNGQEPGTSEDICSFADKQKVKFDLFEKIDVNGDNTHPLWKYLKKQQGGTFGNFIKWNFTKFIVDKKGQVVERHGPNVDPNSLRENLEKYF